MYLDLCNSLLCFRSVCNSEPLKISHHFLPSVLHICTQQHHILLCEWGRKGGRKIRGKLNPVKSPEIVRSLLEMYLLSNTSAASHLIYIWLPGDRHTVREVRRIGGFKISSQWEQIWSFCSSRRLKYHRNDRKRTQQESRGRCEPCFGLNWNSSQTVGILKCH